MGVILFDVEQPFEGPGLWLILTFPVIGWLSVNVLGLASNGVMRDEMGRRYGREFGTPSADLWFVGMARPSFRSVLDPHEEVALIWRDGDHLVVMGDLTRHEIPQSAITDVRLKRNIHSLFFLGGWVSLTWEESSGTQTLLMEPRQKHTLLANNRLRKALMKYLIEG